MVRFNSFAVSFERWFDKKIGTPIMDKLTEAFEWAVSDAARLPSRITVVFFVVLNTLIGCLFRDYINQAFKAVPSGVLFIIAISYIFSSAFACIIVYRKIKSLPVGLYQVLYNGVLLSLAIIYIAKYGIHSHHFYMVPLSAYLYFILNFAVAFFIALWIVIRVAIEDRKPSTLPKV